MKIFQWKYRNRRFEDRETVGEIVAYIAELYDQEFYLDLGKTTSGIEIDTGGIVVYLKKKVEIEV